MCYVLLFIQLLSMNGFFLSVMNYFLCVLAPGLRPCSSLSDAWCYLQTPCVSVDFSCLLWIFSCHPLLGICASVQYIQSSWCAMCCWLCSCWGWMDFYGFFPVCHCVSVVWVIRGVTCRHPVYRRIFFLSVVDFFLSFTSGHLCITPVCSE